MMVCLVETILVCRPTTVYCASRLLSQNNCSVVYISSKPEPSRFPHAQVLNALHELLLDQYPFCMGSRSYNSQGSPKHIRKGCPLLSIDYLVFLLARKNPPEPKIACKMQMTTEAIIAVVALVAGLPPTIYTVWKWWGRGREQRLRSGTRRPCHISDCSNTR